jgi:hypothetical protein
VLLLLLLLLLPVIDPRLCGLDPSSVVVCGLGYVIPILWSTEALIALGAMAFWMLRVVGRAS